MKAIVLLMMTLSGPALAETVDCDLSGVAVRFDIDPSQFAPALDPNEPPKRRITEVQMGETRFEAEPIVMDGIRGFWVEQDEAPKIMMVVQSDGTALLKDSTTNTELAGRCEILK